MDNAINIGGHMLRNLPGRLARPVAGVDPVVQQARIEGHLNGNYYENTWLIGQVLWEMYTDSQVKPIKIPEYRGKISKKNRGVNLKRRTMPYRKMYGRGRGVGMRRTLYGRRRYGGYRRTFGRRTYKPRYGGYRRYRMTYRRRY